MNDRFSPGGPGLPPKLAELDAELSSIRYEERPSFGPELEAELAREWKSIRGRRHVPLRPLLAAGLAGILLVGFAVPSARASLVRLMSVLQRVDTPAEGPVLAPGSQSLPALPFEAPPAVVPERTPPAALGLRPGGGPPQGPRVERYEGPEATFPELLDRPGVEALIRGHYPESLLEAGIGGTVGLRLWVDSFGRVEVAELGGSSGIPELDRAALDLSPSFEFAPARRRGRAVGTWVEFDVRFEVVPEGGEAVMLPEISLPPGGEAPGVPDLSPVPEWTRRPPRPTSGGASAGESLRSAIGDDALIRRLGPIEAILSGDPPEGAAPTRWKAEVGEALEAAMVRDPDNPAPLLALARIRHQQGLRTEARVLYERGLQRARRTGAGVSPTIVAELHYERGMLVRESWLAGASVGRVPAEALATGACPQARSSGGAASGFASADRLIAWNYLCPRELGAAFEASFEPVGQRGHADLSVMMASFVAALEAAPGHVGANVEALLTLAEQERWLEVLDGSRRFVQASEGHPYGLLLEGMALQSLSRAEDAEEQFRRALDALPTHEARQLTDVTALLPVEEAAAHRGLSDEDRASLATDFWRPLDPILSTPVNERRVEHLARATYAYLRFGDTGSDAGQVWVRYGRPARVRVVSEGGGLRTEFWDYGPGPDVTFRRVAADDDLALTAEGRTYLDELRSVFPHGYRSGSRPVSTLAGQVGHFRGDPERRTSLVLIHSQAPDLGPGTGLDTLDLGVFLRTTGGEARTVDRRRVPALAPLTLQVPVGPGVESVVVEVFDARTGRAAALHHEIGRIQGAAGPGLSDLMLVQTSSPRRSDVSLDASWIRPYTLEDPVETHALGMLFELYGGIGELVRYRLRAEAEHRGSGTTHALRIQPAGEERYRFSVERRPTSRRTVEFVNVWVGDLPPGTYALRIWADLNGASVPLATERLLEVR